MSQYTVRKEARKQAAFTESYWRANKPRLRKHRTVTSASADNFIRISVIPARELYGFEKEELEAYFAGDTEGGDLVYKAKLQTRRFKPGVRPAKYGGKGITRYARQLLVQSCAVLQKKYGKKVGLLTCTLPGSTMAAKATFAKHLPAILNLFFTHMRVALNREFNRVSPKATFRKDQEKLDIDYVSCTELQKRGALHIHTGIGFHSQEMFEFIEGQHRTWWCQALETWSKNTGVDLFEREEGGTHRNKWYRVRTEFVKVKKCIKRYLSKYMSKGCAESLKGGVATPSRWWNISENIQQAVRDARQQVVFESTDLDECKAMAYALQEAIGEDACFSRETKNPFTNEWCGFYNWYEGGDEVPFFAVAKALMEEPGGRECIERISKQKPPPPDKAYGPYPHDEDLILWDPTPRVVW